MVRASWLVFPLQLPAEGLGHCIIRRLLVGPPIFLFGPLKPRPYLRCCQAKVLGENGTSHLPLPLPAVPAWRLAVAQ